MPNGSRRTTARAAALTALLFTLAACEQAATSPEAQEAARGDRGSANAANSNAPFQTWHQGFNHGTVGWYGGETAAPLGWCGSIEQVMRGEGAVSPSAGRAYATVSQGPCHPTWTTAEGGDFGFFSPDLVNAPWAPGPDFALYSESWPPSGFVYELDIYLDPTYSAAEPPAPSFNDQVPGGTVFTVLAAIRELGNPPEASSFRYFGVQVFPGDGALLVQPGDFSSVVAGSGAHEVTRAGWYQFRWVFHSDDGGIAADFELRDRSGGTLFTRPFDVTFYEVFGGVPLSELSTSDFGSGYTWFGAIAHGLELPIDEHRVGRGR